MYRKLNVTIVSLSASAAAALLAAGSLPTPALAQAITGRVVSADSARPVAGAIVVLADSVHHELTRTLSRSDGAFALRVPTPASYNVRVLRIGYRPEDFGPFASDQSASRSLVLALAERPVSLAAVRVTGSRECRRLEEGGEGPFALWEEARKSLLVTVLTRSAFVPVVTVANYERVVDIKTQHQIAFRVRQQTGASARPYVSPLSPDQYAERGYIEESPDGTVYRAPDADVLLSESFLATHCLRVVTSSQDSSLIGLGFRPTKTVPGVIDVEGVLWLNRAPVELRSIEVTYVGVADAVRDAGAGASLTVSPIAGGGSIVTSWAIRAPRVIAVRSFRASAGATMGSLTGHASTRDSVADLWIFGGAVMRVRVDGADVWRGPAGVVRGRVSEESSGRPVRGSHVALVGTNYETSADSDGVFAIADVLPGVYELEARSPELDALGVDVPTTTRLVLGDSTTTLTIRTLPLRRALAHVCAMDDTLGAVQGRVVDAEQRGIGGARVVAQWFTAANTSENQGFSFAGVYLAALADTDGRFRICGLPRGHVVSLSAANERLVAARQPVRIEPGNELVVVTLVTHQSERPPTSDGFGAVDGVVRDDAGRPMKNVEVDLMGMAATRTDSLGHFQFGQLVGGTFLLRARSLGWSAPVTPVSVELGLRTNREIVMRHVQLLEGITVSALAAGGDQGFARRAAAGHGTFLTEQQIAERNARTTEELIATFPGVTVSTDKAAGAGGLLLVDRGFITLFGTQCKGVAVIVDGTDAGEGFNLAQINPRDLRGVEFYRGTATTPPEFRTTRTVCGTLVLWLK